MSTDPIARAFEAVGSLPEPERGFLQHVLMQAIAVPELATEAALAEHLQLLPKVLQSLSLPPSQLRQLDQRPDLELWANGAVHTLAVIFAANTPNVSLGVLTKLTHLSLSDSRFLANFLENKPRSDLLDPAFLESLESPDQRAISGIDFSSMPPLERTNIFEVGPTGWKLAEFKVPNRPGVYVGYNCGEHEGALQILVVRSEQRPIAEYLARRITTRDLLTAPNDNVGFLVSLDRPTYRTRLVVVSELPPAMLPAVTARYTPDLRPDSPEVPQAFLVEESWSAELFHDLEKNYQTAFALTYFLDEASERSLPSEVHDWDLDGYGYPRMHRYLRNALPQNENARATGVAAASPGVLTITATKHTAEKLALVLKAFESNETRKAYKAVYRWSPLDEDDKEQVPDSARDDIFALAGILSVDTSRLIRGQVYTKAALLRGGKILASYYRLLRGLVKPPNGVEFLPPEVPQPPSALKVLGLTDDDDDNDPKFEGWDDEDDLDDDESDDEQET